MNCGLFMTRAFGQIVAHRVSGHSTLYGSDFRHNATIRVTISTSELNRSLSHDWHFSRDELIEVEMSEAQWATFISSLNVSSGVPCTLLRVRGQEEIAGLPPPQDRSRQFAGEVEEDCQDCLDVLDGLLKRVDETSLPKGKTKELKEAVSRAIMALRSSLPFVAESFGKHAESVIEKAKQEVHGYMLGVISRTGIVSLQEAAVLPLQLTDETSKTTSETEK